MSELKYPHANFNSCVSSILEHEGGLTNDPNDPGGITNWGISLRFLLDVEPTQHPSASTIQTMTKEQAIQIYKQFWWDKYNYEMFDYQLIVEKVFDLAVNMGNREATKLLQRSINHVHPAAELVIDGLLGRNTFQFSNRVDPPSLRQQLRQYAKDRYIEIATHNPDMERFLKGWLNRAAW